ncbi:MAG: pyridoxal phosphate-dependent aminotransferase [Bacteroidota bacterium]|nr:pyridoxal phosphate-dependent aminotransferase [Bacteroidota bacterium]
MPSISSKGQSMPDSPIRKLAPFATAAKAAGKRVIHLNIGQPDITTPEVALDAVRQDTRTVIEYSPSEGFASYREGLAAYYRSVNVEVTADDILVTTGGSEALVFAFMSCLNPGDQVIIPEPFYANYNGFAQMAGVEVVPVTASLDDGFALPPIEAFASKINDKTKAILLCNPGNPTGTVYAPEALDALAELVRAHDLYLFADEVYREFCYDGAKPKSVMELPGLEDNVVLVDSVSKRYSMCGARIGALVTKNPAVRKAAMKLAMARLSPPTLAQVASEAALQTSADYFKEVRERYVERRDALVEGLREIPGVKVPTPGGAFYAVCELPIDNADAFCQWMLEHFDLDGDTVMMAPATGFYATPGAGTREVRIAYVLDVSDIRRAVACLAAGLEQYPGRR